MFSGRRLFVTGPAVFELGPSQLCAGAVVFIDLGMAFVALEAPAHVELADSVRHCHVRLNLAMTFLALHASAHVALVAEVNEVGEVVDLVGQGIGSPPS